MSRLNSAEVGAVIESFVARVTDDRESLLKVCLSGGEDLAVASRYVVEQTNLSPKAISKRTSYFEPIFDAMRAEGIIIPVIRRAPAIGAVGCLLGMKGCLWRRSWPFQ